MRPARTVREVLIAARWLAAYGRGFRYRNVIGTMSFDVWGPIRVVVANSRIKTLARARLYDELINLGHAGNIKSCAIKAFDEAIARAK
jgi:hypothetical protein